MKMIKGVAIAVMALGPNLAFAGDTAVVNLAVSEKDVTQAQEAWCDALVSISSANREGGQEAAKALAEDVIDAAYAYQMGAVLFKPTLTVNPQTFRTTREGAVAYFVGGDDNFPEDSGFALKGWKKCKIDNAGIFINGNNVTTMGKVIMTDENGDVTTVDKTWGFVKDDAGALRIYLHHSSLEFTP